MNKEDLIQATMERLIAEGDIKLNENGERYTTPNLLKIYDKASPLYNDDTYYLGYNLGLLVAAIDLYNGIGSCRETALKIINNEYTENEIDNAMEWWFRQTKYSYEDYLNIYD